LSETPFWFRPVRAAMFRFWLLKRGLTFGVRAVVFDGNGRVLLVKHSYVPGWHFPGGGVEPGETAVAAMIRECREEAGVAIEEPFALHGLFHNAKASARDHVAVFIVRAFAADGPPPRTAEIVDSGFFALDALPEGTTAATHRRLAEIASGAAPSAEW